ncbi:MAG: hypothetical protein HYY16_08190 [Planctomycetes bacterium]|nr:hypothetical protein [Planctomycetota bacterium]
MTFVRGNPAVVRTPYFFQDPIRAGGLVCALLLMFLREVPVPVALFAIGLSQLNGIAMIIDMMGRGWSLRWGRRAHASVLTNNLAIDWANTSICTLVGAMLLMRFFGPPELVVALGCLTLAIGLMPDIRFCRVILPADPEQASRLLERGTFLRDPIKLGGLCAMAIVLVLDRTALAFVFVSMVLVQLNAILVMVDKYLAEIEIRRDLARVPFRSVRLLLARDGQRVLLALLPRMMVPLRLGMQDSVVQWTALIVGGFVVVPDVARSLVHLFSRSPVEPFDRSSVQEFVRSA